MGISYDIVREYMARVQSVYATGETTEHSFRPALEYLFKNIADDVQCINEPKMVTDVGRPDFVFKRTVGDNLITIGHCEAKDIDKDVTPRAMSDSNKAQHKRYINGLPNLIYTNGLDFHFYVQGELKHEVSIADFAVGISPKPQRYPELIERLKEFARQRVQTITSPERLAKLMAGKAILVKTALFRTLKQDEELRSELGGQYKAFKDQLIHDLTPEGFADIYAETVAYGLFAARLHDDTPEDFSREEALQLLPKSNPFLRKLFEFIARQDLDRRIKGDIDELAEIFQATNLKHLFENFGSFTQRNDPFIHFYETFLAEYNPKKRKARGVWYTPEPVVNFIVRAVDDVLKTEFGLADGLADTSKIDLEINTGKTKIVKRKNKTDGKMYDVQVPVVETQSLHRVQVLDPATGTGTFLAEVIRLVGDRVKGIAPGKWSGYVEDELIPRLHGFELLMASYAMCHMKLDMMLSEMGYKPRKDPPRLSVYLTNSLEEPEEEVRDLLMARWLSDEAQGANAVKRDKPIMCIIGNPPYSGISQNMGSFAASLIEPYKYVDGQHFGERKHWLHDDYVKFVALAESMINQNGEGVLGFITNNSYLENPTFRGMRQHLEKSFNSIHILNLHGEGHKNKKGTRDENIFDIQKGVAVIVAVKRSNSTEQPFRLVRKDYVGRRHSKSESLLSETLYSTDWQEIITKKPNYSFSPTNETLLRIYNSGIKLTKLFSIHSVGIMTAADNFTVSDRKSDLLSQIQEFFSKDLSASEFREQFRLGKNYPDWIISNKENIDYSDLKFLPISFRPLDERWICYHRDVLWRTRSEVMDNMYVGQNYALLTGRRSRTPGNQPSHFFVTNHLSEAKTAERTTQSYHLPLYLYPDPEDLDQTRRVNMDPKIRKAIEDEAELPTHGRPDEVAIFDYIYGVLHCPAYRETYAEFLKIDFPRVPYPSSPEAFWDISAKGTQLRRLHLMEADVIGETPYPYAGEGDDVVAKGYPKFDGRETGTVLINKTQGFQNVPRLSWEFYIGGYQPAQKWLKDRRERELSMDDIRHYQRIIKILSETDRIMKTIEMDLG